MIELSSCPKGYTKDLDKVITPAETVARVKAKLYKSGMNILSDTVRIDTGRLGIPVFLSVCGDEARRILPTRKQMGKGSSEEQAQASAVMELMERYSYFSFWEREDSMVSSSWLEAEKQFGDALISVEEILKSVQDELPKEDARRILNILPWKFHQATCLTTGKDVWLPVDWFKLLSEFNGTSSGNTNEESLLQGCCELIERHVCCCIDRERTETPTIDKDSIDDPVLRNLIELFERENIHLVLKDFSMGMPIPTVAAVAWDESTFPETSEIVFTAGTASSPQKAAIRAVTEIAQLAGDFCTGACYEASGLTKFTRLQDINWLLRGDTRALSSLPTVEDGDIRNELLSTIRGLKSLGYNVYAVQTTHPELDIPAHYTIIPGLTFRERDKNQSLGLFVGRRISESADWNTAEKGLKILESCYSGAHFLPFFRGMLELRNENYLQAYDYFLLAAPKQPESDAEALSYFYAGYALTLVENWKDALPHLEKAFDLCPDMKEYGNFCGVSCFKQQNYEKAAYYFRRVLKIDKGSMTDMANLGVCMKYLGKTEEAEKYLTIALRTDPSLESARKHLEELRKNV